MLLDHPNEEVGMNYQNEMLPEGAIKVGSTPSMNEETVVPGILKKHLAPKGKYGYLVVEQGSLQFVWEAALAFLTLGLRMLP